MSIIGKLTLKILTGYSRVSSFIISLDFELKWGVVDIDNYDDNVLGARDVIPKILDLFVEYDIRATWATVGMLFCSTNYDFEKYKPSLFPSYDNAALDSYKETIGKSEKTDKLHYAYTLIELINKTAGQEIASHTYSHYYTLEESQEQSEFKKDIDSAVKISIDKFNIKPISIVFPRNQINNNYLKMLKSDFGFTHFRGNPISSIYSNGHNPTRFIYRVVRFVDSFVNITGYQTSLTKKDSSGLINVPGSRMLRPFIGIKFLNFIMLRRIKKEMLFCAKNNKNYHLWWHPHNFGVNQEENLKNLEELLQYYSLLSSKYKMKSSCMKDIC